MTHKDPFMQTVAVASLLRFTGNGKYKSGFLFQGYPSKPTT